MGSFWILWVIFQVVLVFMGRGFKTNHNFDVPSSFVLPLALTWPIHLLMFTPGRFVLILLVLTCSGDSCINKRI